MMPSRYHNMKRSVLPFIRIVYAYCLLSIVGCQTVTNRNSHAYVSDVDLFNVLRDAASASFVREAFVSNIDEYGYVRVESSQLPLSSHNVNDLLAAAADLVPVEPPPFVGWLATMLFENDEGLPIVLVTVYRYDSTIGVAKPTGTRNMGIVYAGQTDYLRSEAFARKLVLLSARIDPSVSNCVPEFAVQRGVTFEEMMFTAWDRKLLD